MCKDKLRFLHNQYAYNSPWNVLFNSIWTSGSNVLQSYIAFQGLLIASQTVHAVKIEHLPYYMGSFVWKISFLQSFPPQANGRWYLHVFWNGGVAQKFIFRIFFPQLWLLEESKLQRPLINGTRGSPAPSHSSRHKRQAYGAEPGMEYWRIEWKHTHKRPNVTSVQSYSPLFIVYLCWRGSAAGVAGGGTDLRHVKKLLSRGFEERVHPNKHCWH